MNAIETKTYHATPRPLIYPKEKIMLIFSAKSACSSSVIWLFHRMGLAAEARAFSEWPHDYRVNSFYRRRDVIDGARFVPLQEYRIVKVMRDPIDRVLSSYRHALSYGYPRDLIQDKLGIDMVEQGLSLKEFIDFLETEDLSSCDIHHRKQFHPLELIQPPVKIINISKEDLFSGLNEFESLCGLNRTDFSSLEWLHRLQHERTPIFSEDAGDLYLRRFTVAEAKNGPWPKRLMCDLAYERIVKLYASDIERYAPYI